ncbi:hypothetical protein GWD52_06365 [Enterobacteriaceae bacterium 4M9]|nr:hypothetical protein [Enterobacteriaceae bacterium 4M9]
MGRPAARLFDITCHGGIIVTGSCNVFTNKRPAAVVGISLAVCCLHGIAPVVTGSGSVFINNLPAARFADLTGCCALIISGSGNVFIGR